MSCDDSDQRDLPEHLANEVISEFLQDSALTLRERLAVLMAMVPLIVKHAAGLENAIRTETMLAYVKGQVEAGACCVTWRDLVPVEGEDA